MFRVPEHLFPITYTLEDLLDVCQEGKPVVAETTLQPGPSQIALASGWSLKETWEGDVKIQPPSDQAGLSELLDISLYSAIETPYRLVLSPHPDGRWAYSSPPVHDKASDRTELWHARLGVKGQEEGEVNEKRQCPARAVWPPHFGEPGMPAPPSLSLHKQVPFRMSLDARDRYELVLLSSCAEPVEVDRLMLRISGTWHI